jgi:hypothetical protein
VYRLWRENAQGRVAPAFSHDPRFSWMFLKAQGIVGIFPLQIGTLTIEIGFVLQIFRSAWGFSGLGRKRGRVGVFTERAVGFVL